MSYTKELNLNDFKTSWIESKFEAATIDYAEKFGSYLASNRLTTSQIRNIFGEVKRIQAKSAEGLNRKDFLLLKPKIAYAAKRAGTRGIDSFKQVMDKAHGAVINQGYSKEAFQNFVDFFEATLAYHKAAGGRD